MSILKLDHVSHYYFYKKGYTKTLEDISLRVPEGSFISLLGPSGCGKSTLLSIIAAIIEPTQGKITIEQQDISESKLEIGYMLQKDYLFPWKTILDNVLIGPKIQQKKQYAIKEKAIKQLEDIGLSSVIDSYPHSLSGGMRQRAALVRMLMTDPKLFLLDEPFSDLDFLTKIKLEELTSQLLKEYNKTSILVTHDIGEAIAMSDKIYLMKANPGEMHQTFEVPIEIRNLAPLQARKHVKYQQLFDRVWEELNSLETSTV